MQKNKKKTSPITKNVTTGACDNFHLLRNKGNHDLILPSHNLASLRVNK